MPVVFFYMCKAQQRLLKLKFVHELENLLQIEIAEMWIEKKIHFHSINTFASSSIGSVHFKWGGGGAAPLVPTPLTLLSEQPCYLFSDQMQLPTAHPPCEKPTKVTPQAGMYIHWMLAYNPRNLRIKDTLKPAILSFREVIMVTSLLLTTSFDKKKNLGGGRGGGREGGL